MTNFKSVEAGQEFKTVYGVVVCVRNFDKREASYAPCYELLNFKDNDLDIRRVPLRGYVGLLRDILLRKEVAGSDWGHLPWAKLADK